MSLRNTGASACRSWSGPILLASFVFLFFASISNAQSNSSVPTGCQVALQLDFGGESGQTGIEQNWKSLSVIGLLLSGAFISLIYMIGKAMDSPTLVSRAKTDIIQVMVTAILLIFLYSLLSVICSIDGKQFGLKFSSIFDGAENYFEYARLMGLSAYLKSTNSIMTLTGLSTLVLTVPDAIALGSFAKIGLFLKVFGGYNIPIGALNWLASLVMLSISLMKGYVVVLNAIELNFLNLLFPAGIVMRCFSPTRDFGGVLISLSLGLFLFFPFMFSFSYMILGQPDPSQVSMPSMNWYSKIIGQFVTFQAATIVPFLIFAVLPDKIYSMGTVAASMLSDSFSAIGATLLPVFILPALNWIILAALVRELSKALGQEVDISGLARMI